jgi:hypothetical protein
VLGLLAQTGMPMTNDTCEISNGKRFLIYHLT